MKIIFEPKELIGNAILETSFDLGPLLGVTPLLKLQILKKYFESNDSKPERVF